MAQSLDSIDLPFDCAGGCGGCTTGHELGVEVLPSLGEEFVPNRCLCSPSNDHLKEMSEQELDSGTQIRCLLLHGVSN